MLFLFYFFILLLFCATACQNNKYGTECSKSCGRCVNGEQCNPVNGTCPNGCAAGYYQPRCKKSILADKKHSEKSPHSVFFHERIKLPQALCQDKLKILMKSVYTFNLFIYKKKKNLWRYVQNFHFWDSFRMPSKLIRKKLFAKLQ